MTFMEDGQESGLASGKPCSGQPVGGSDAAHFRLPAPGETLNNQALSRRAQQACQPPGSDRGPQYPPLITQPGDGEYCYSDGVIL